MIRKAEFKDVSGIMEVAKDAHEKSLSSSVSIDPKTLRNSLQVCILSTEHFVLVVELEGNIEEVLADTRAWAEQTAQDLLAKEAYRIKEAKQLGEDFANKIN